MRARARREAQAPSFCTLPALRQEVQTFRRLLVPLIRVRTLWMFGFQRREVRRCEWDTLLPKLGPLAQMSHVEATVSLLRNRNLFGCPRRRVRSPAAGTGASLGSSDLRS